jgi:glycerate 2-kinase
VRVVIAPDGFGGTLSARAAADAMVAGWRRARPQDGLRTVPMSDGGTGLVDVLIEAGRAPATAVRTTEVAGPHGHPVEARWLLLGDGTAVIESAEACGLHLLPVERRDPLLATTYGVGQLVVAAASSGARRILIGLGGSATVDGGTGALSGLGYRLTVADGSGLKIGGDDLGRVAAASVGWAPDLSDVEVLLLADVTTTLLDAAERFGPQKGAGPHDVVRLAEGLRVWSEVAARDLPGGPDLRDVPGSGAAGGLGFGLAAALGARFVTGSAAVASLVGLADAIEAYDLVVTGEGRLDATTAEGKVVAYVHGLARNAGRRTLAVVGQVGDGAPALDDVEPAAPGGPGEDPVAEVADAAERLATRVTG